MRQMEAAGEATWSLPPTPRFTSDTEGRVADALVPVTFRPWRGRANGHTGQPSSCTSCHPVTSVQTHTSGLDVRRRELVWTPYTVPAVVLTTDALWAYAEVRVLAEDQAGVVTLMTVHLV